MTEQPEVRIFDGADELVHGVTQALVAALSGSDHDSNSANQPPESPIQLSLTGGRIAQRLYNELGQFTLEQAVRSRLQLWWSDERFVPADSPDRNAEPALAALSGLGLNPDQVHPMPSAVPGLDLTTATQQYADELGSTQWDICLLGLGPDGHVASLFPGFPQAHQSGLTVSVHNSPKPPPERISVTMDVINASRQVWFIVSGADKAHGMYQALSGDLVLPGGDTVPGYRARGREKTLFFADSAAAGETLG